MLKGFALLFQVRWCAVVIGGDFNLVLDVEKGKKNGIARTHQKFIADLIFS